MSTDYDLINLLDNLLKTTNIKTLSLSLNVANGTIKRWLELKAIPKQYTFDILKLSKINIDYSKFSFKDKDQFYTPNDTVNYCFSKSLEILQKYNININEYVLVEPSAGSGNFVEKLKNYNYIAMDIEPKNNNIKKQDFLEWTPDVNLNNKYIVIGNPPFGLRGHLALKFINHASSFADFVIFILPQLFESDGKGVPRKRVKNLNLIHSEKIKSVFLSPTNDSINVNCIFQIWSKNIINKDYDITKINDDIIKIYSLSDGGSPSTTRNKKMFYKCDIYLPSTCFGKDNMKYYMSFNDLPRKKGYGIVFKKNKNENIEKFKSIVWSNIAFLSTNSAYNIRSSQIAELFK